MAVLIYKSFQSRPQLVSQSKNLRGILDHARKSPVSYATIWRSNDRGEGMLYLTFEDGAWCRAPFADYYVARIWLRARRSWQLDKLSEWPDREVWHFPPWSNARNPMLR